MIKVQKNTSLKSVFGITLMTAALGLTACSTSVDPDVKARQDSMKSWGDAMGVMSDMAEAPETFDAEVFKEQASYLASDAATPWTHFENSEALGNATSAVWSNNDDFTAKAAHFQQVTAELDAAAQSATSIEEVLPALGAVGESCKSCHTDYKVKDNG
ncbi:cytochrome c [Psychrobacter sp. F1192]|uniref:Cytochrome c n=1 Tax=Psychrobacter coccoides TaxID=2818440 RepID=A0ABS3NPV1_9GAMM|nr:cytochrome c [Psychrobacter coccoides]MBO1531378.1 cytochrome c [Psychrobacter coccoides]